MRAYAESFADVGGERPDIRPGRACHEKRRLSPWAGLEVLKHDVMDMDRTGLPGNNLTSTRLSVKSLAADLHRGHHGRHLLDLADERLQRLTKHRLVDQRGVMLRSDVAARVERRRLHPKPYPGVVGLDRCLKIRNQPSRFAQAEDEHAGRIWVKGPSVPHLALI